VTRKSNSNRAATVAQSKILDQNIDLMLLGAASFAARPRTRRDPR
jgi:hypothetical protein